MMLCFVLCQFSQPLLQFVSVMHPRLKRLTAGWQSVSWKDHIEVQCAVLDCAVGTTDRFLSSVSPFMRVGSNSGVADPGAAAARPGTRVVELLFAELPDCSSMFESWETRVIELSSCFVTRGTPGGAIEWGAAQVRRIDFAPFHVTLDDVFKPSDRPALWTFPRRSCVYSNEYVLYTCIMGMTASADIEINCYVVCVIGHVCTVMRTPGRHTGLSCVSLYHATLTSLSTTTSPRLLFYLRLSNYCII